MQPRERENSVGEIAVNILGRMKYRPVLLDPEIHLKDSKIENSPVVDECNYTHNRRDKQQSVQGKVDRARKATCQPSGIRGEGRRRMTTAIPESRNEQRKQREAEQRMYIDPGGLSLLGPRIVQKTQNTDNHDQHESRPMKCYGTGPIASCRG